MNSLIWKVNRLRAMDTAEIAYRLKQAIQNKLESTGWNLATTPPLPEGKAGFPHLAELPTTINSSPYLQVADRVLSGIFEVFSLHTVNLGFPPNWNQDPLTGIIAPLTFGKTLNYRDQKIVGNIKYLWEPNRHLELVSLAQAWHLSGKTKYSEGCKLLLESWFEQCPYPLGANWTSSLEHAVRLINWAVAWQLLGGDNAMVFQHSEGQAFRSRWLDVIYQHLYFIAGHFSKHSSANNHLLGECMGLLVGSLTWPFWQKSKIWRDMAHKLFEKESLTQNTPDGVNREQATWYHHEVADMMLICALIGKANAIQFSQTFWERLEAMLDFIAAIMDIQGNVPMFGDSDDAVMVHFSREANFNPYRSLLATGAVLFDRSDFKDKAGTFDDKSLWLLGETGRQAFDRLPTVHNAPPRKTAFTEGGIYIMGTAWGTDKEIRLVADVAPLGYLSIAAHGHADALSFTLSLAGEEILIDPGTYAYHTQKKWRDYFKGTSAHNTVRIDHVDQSLIGGNFMWLRHAKATLESYSSTVEMDCLRGHHDGYLALKAPVLHRREVILNKELQSIQIHDILETKGQHQIEIHWHCHEDAKVTLEHHVAKVIRGRSALWISMPDTNLKPHLARGEDSPPLGWVSRHFDHKAPTTTIVWSGQINNTCTFVTNMTINWL